MKQLFTTLVAIVVLLMAYGCPNPMPHPIKFGLDKHFSLQLGQTAECAEAEGFSIMFERVVGDSRCPLGVQCVTAGKADIALALSKGGQKESVTLSFTRPDGAENVTVFGGHTIRIDGVSPFRQQEKEIKPEEYLIALFVTENKQ